MGELWKRLGRLNQVSSMIAAAVLVGVMVKLIVTTPLAGAIITVFTAGLLAFGFWCSPRTVSPTRRLRRPGCSVRRRPRR